jgi:hypothetical protein
MKKEQYQPPGATRPILGGAEPFDSLFEHARRDAFTPGETERLWQSVVSAGPGGGEGGPQMPEGGMRGWGSGTALKATAVFVVAGGLLAVAFALKRPASREPIAAPSGPAQMAVGVGTAGVERGPPVVSWEDLPRAQGPAQGEAKLSAPTAPRGRGASASEPAGAVESGSAAVAEPAPPVVAASPSEGALLLRARQVLPSNPASALALTEEAGRRFPEGALGPEREVLATEALARLGRLPAARARLAAFRARYPESPHLARLESLLTQ